MPQSWSLPKVEADDELALEVARIPVEQGLWAPVSPWNPYTHFWASPSKPNFATEPAEARCIVVRLQSFRADMLARVGGGYRNLTDMIEEVRSTPSE